MTLPFAKETLDDFIATPRPCAREAARKIDGDVLVLGAAGKMGFHLCLMLRRCFEENGQDNRVVAVSRFSSPGSKEQFESRGIDTLACDLSNEDQLARLPDARHVWFMAGVKFGTQDSPELLHKMNVEMPDKVAQRFKDARVVALSTGCVYPFVPIGSGGADEATPLEKPLGKYAESCRGREAAFQAVSEQEGMQAVLIRLNYAVEMRYGVLVDIATKIIDREAIDLSTGYFNCIWQGDALAHIIAAESLAESPAAVLNVTGPETLSTRETAEKLGRLLGIDPVFTGEEQPTAWLNNAQKAAQLFGKPEVSPDRMAEWIAEWLKSGGDTLGKPTKFEVRSGNF